MTEKSSKTTSKKKSTAKISGKNAISRGKRKANKVKINAENMKLLIFIVVIVIACILGIIFGSKVVKDSNNNNNNANEIPDIVDDLPKRD